MSAHSRASMRLGRKQRLKERREFLRLRSQGKRVVKGCLIANWLPLVPPALSRLGVVTSRKLGNAPIRSRARRLLREAFRLHQNELSGPIALVLIARASIVGKAFSAVERDFLGALHEAKVLKPSA